MKKMLNLFVGVSKPYGPRGNKKYAYVASVHSPEGNTTTDVGVRDDKSDYLVRQHILIDFFSSLKKAGLKDIELTYHADDDRLWSDWREKTDSGCTTAIVGADELWEEIIRLSKTLGVTLLVAPSNEYPSFESARLRARANEYAYAFTNNR